MRIVRTKIETAIEIARSCENATEKEFANGIVKETGITENQAVVIEIEDKGIIEAAAETDRIEIEARIVIVTEIDIGTGKDRSKTEDFLKD